MIPHIPRVFPLVLLMLFAGPPGCATDAEGQQSKQQGLAMDMLNARGAAKIDVQSPAFSANAPIPNQFSDYGQKISPTLSWTGLPPETKSVALLMEDPDAPKPKPYIHWVLYNLSPDQDELREGIPNLPRLRDLGGALQGKNSSGSVGYFGPRPPKGDPPHHYHFQVFALDRELDLPFGVARSELLEAMKGHVLASGELVGTFQQPKDK